MSTNRTRRMRNQKGVLTPAEVAYLTDDDSGIPEKSCEGYDLWSLRNGFTPIFGSHGSHELWEVHRAQFLPKFIQENPGRRPLPWWQWDAPRCDTGSGAYFEPLPIPRQQIGGKGETTWEKYPAVVPSYKKGIPSSWEWIDPEDPPMFESEAAYLDRHGFLNPTEKKFVEKHPELLDPEKVVFDEDEEEKEEEEEQ